MILKNARQIDGVFFEVLEGSDRIEKGAVIHLSAQFDGIAIGIDVALPDVLKYVVRLDRITWHKFHKHCPMDGVRREAYNQRLELAVDSSAIRPTGRQVEAWGEKVVGPILVRVAEDVTLHLRGGHRAKIGRANPRCERVGCPRTVG